MKLLTITNLYPRPDQPQRGLFNAQLFAALVRTVAGQWGAVQNVCLVPEWRAWRWRKIGRWEDPLGEATSVHTSYLPVPYVPLIGRNLSWQTYTKAMEKIEGAAAEADRILGTWLYPDAVAAVELGQRANKPVWIKVHGSDLQHLAVRARKEKIMEACDKAAGLVCVSEGLIEELESQGIPRSKLFLVPNGVDTQKFCYRGRKDAVKGLLDVGGLPEGIQSILATGADARIILFVGNLVKVKGPDLLVDAWIEMEKRSDEFGAAAAEATLVVVGGGPMRADLEKKIKASGLWKRTFFIGAVSHEAVSLWMNVAQCLCMPSRSEGMPNVMMEAIASGLPVVATDVGVSGELLAEHHSSRVVPIETKGIGGATRLAGRKARRELKKELVGALVAVLDDVVDRRREAERGRNQPKWSDAAELLAKAMGCES